MSAAISAREASVEAPAPRRFAFVFPLASGHINPSFPLARSLVRLGHEVHYLCREQMRDAIEDTGATWHSDIENMPEMYEGRKPALMGAIEDIQREYGLEGESEMHAWMKLGEILLELMLPGAIRWLRQLGPHAVVCCPMMSREAVYAAKYLDIPRVSLLTTAGPGSLEMLMHESLAMVGLKVSDALEMRRSFGPLQECLDRLQRDYGLKLNLDDMLEPVGLSDALIDSSITLVTTSEDLQDPMSPELAGVYRDRNVKFVNVGPLLDQEGARRAAGHKFHHQEDEQPASMVGLRDPVALLKEARAAGRKVVLASMGTVITGDAPQVGWHGRMEGADGLPQGLTGRELCQAAWGGVFDAFGAGSAEEGALLLMALGPQPKALGELEAPPNALCLPNMPQVDLLKAGVDLFLTHGGQNSFTEALSVGVPVVVCPGFADQPVNARKAVELGVGLQVERPVPARGQEPTAAIAYRAEVSAKMREVLEAPSYAEAARGCAERLRTAGGVPRAVELILEAAAVGKIAEDAAAIAKVGAGNELSCRAMHAGGA